MTYRVHKITVDLAGNPQGLEAELNRLTGEIVSIFPNVRRPTLAWIYGIQRSVDFVVVVEKL